MAFYMKKGCTDYTMMHPAEDDKAERALQFQGVFPPLESP